jgi:hypothetical protein
MQRLLLVGGESEVALDHQALRDGRVAGEAELRGHRPFVHLPAARERRLLAMQRDPAARDGRVLERAAHQAGRCDRHAVVGEAGRARVRELPELGQLGTGLALRDCGQEADRDLRLRASDLDEGPQRRGGVDDGLRVRHREDRAVAARRGGRRARRDRLLVLATRCPQVDVRIDERRREHEPVGVDHLVRVRVEVGAEGGDHAVVNAHVHHRVHALDGIQHTCAAHHEVFGWGLLGEEHHATPTGSPTGTGAGAPTSRS